MNFIYYGTIFVLLSFSINLGGSQIELFPDAIGYFLILILHSSQSVLAAEKNPLFCSLVSNLLIAFMTI
ncbi:MAG: hypothetical protein HGA35_04155 [Erysipelotrichaceae bacterium]|nr:hypothetical protein [Erysipelotrichaceae bacterium]